MLSVLAMLRRKYTRKYIFRTVTTLLLSLAKHSQVVSVIEATSIMFIQEKSSEDCNNRSVDTRLG